MVVCQALNECGEVEYPADPAPIIRKEASGFDKFTREVWLAQRRVFSFVSKEVTNV